MQTTRKGSSHCGESFGIASTAIDLTSVISLGKDTKKSVQSFVKNGGKFTAGEIADLSALIDRENPLLERLDPSGSAFICATLLQSEPCQALSRALYLVAVSKPILLLLSILISR